MVARRCPVLESVFLVPTSGPVAQLGARMNGIHEVTGSTPVWSTISLASLRFLATLGGQRWRCALAAPRRRSSVRVRASATARSNAAAVRRARFRDRLRQNKRLAQRPKRLQPRRRTVLDDVFHAARADRVCVSAAGWPPSL